MKNPQTFNRYSYVLNSPYKFVDPLGLSARCGPGCLTESEYDGTQDKIDEGKEKEMAILQSDIIEYVTVESGPEPPIESNAEYDVPFFPTDEAASNNSKWFWDSYKTELFHSGRVVYRHTYVDFSISLSDDDNKMLNDLYAEAFSHYYTLEILTSLGKESELTELTVEVGGKIGFSGDKDKPVNAEINAKASGKVTYVSVKDLKNKVNSALQGENFTSASSKLQQLTYVNPRTGKTESVTKGMARDMIGFVKSKAKEQAGNAARDWLSRTTPR